MRSTMHTTHLQIRRILEHGARVHANGRIVTAGPGGTRHEEVTYAETARNAARLANALRALGVGEGDPVATFMWNNQQHVEAYFAVPAMGAVVHPLNIRLPAEQLIHIARHAGDAYVIVDHSLVPSFLPLLPHLEAVRHVIVNGPADLAALREAAAGAEVHDYQDLLGEAADTYDWPDLDERSAAAMCYTSGTTGRPKGVVYSHRSVYLHSVEACLPDAFALSREDMALAVVPQFHVLAWSLPYAAFLTGASLALPDRFLAAAPLAAFIAEARPTKGAGVPTIWGALLRHAEENPEADLSSLREIVAGGAAVPASMVRAYAHRHGIALLQAWGMTETSPLGSFYRPDGPHGRAGTQVTQGRFTPSVEARLIGADGRELPWDGQAVGELQVRGPWVTASYHGDDETHDSAFDDGWLRTGDVGRILDDGRLDLTDRLKDVIKSGGEWISSLALENHLADHPAVVEACVVGIPDDTWGERPLACVVLGAEPVDAALLKTFLTERLEQRWQVPEYWSFLSSIPRNSTGKHDKKEIRERHRNAALTVITV
ncbi:long-chain-fatty-acid--CoA ligase [Streptomyces sp. AC627_RSS907]|uniref:long-chain-fatty-acid--CoA ligase n=1 Tax=Streptomyces sp. AC627_RSS907 TaxID=2823684 RepID=UPI001C258524|nr:long-chain-fatty-acid--CoA ligase [Streptomyces sp. AC627_RSS907]